MACYAAGIPYQGRVTASTVLFAGFFFGAEHLYRVRIERKRNAHAITG